MNQYEAIGVIETQYFTIASEILDAVCKGANVEFLTSENYLGGRLVSLIIGGSVSDIKAAIEIAEQVCAGKQGNPLKMALAIMNPHEEIMKFIVPAQTASVVEETVTEVSKSKDMVSEDNEAIKDADMDDVDVEEIKDEVEGRKEFNESEEEK